MVRHVGTEREEAGDSVADASTVRRWTVTNDWLRKTERRL